MTKLCDSRKISAAWKKSSMRLACFHASWAARRWRGSMLAQGSEWLPTHQQKSILRGWLQLDNSLTDDAWPKRFRYFVQLFCTSLYYLQFAHHSKRLQDLEASSRRPNTWTWDLGKSNRERVSPWKGLQIMAFFQLFLWCLSGFMNLAKHMSQSKTSRQQKASEQGNFTC